MFTCPRGAVGQFEVGEQAGQPLADDGEVVAAGFLAQGAGKPGLSDTARTSGTMPGVRFLRREYSTPFTRARVKKWMLYTADVSPERNIWWSFNPMGHSHLFRSGSPARRQVLLISSVPRNCQSHIFSSFGPVSTASQPPLTGNHSRRQEEIEMSPRRTQQKDLFHEERTFSAIPAPERQALLRLIEQMLVEALIDANPPLAGDEITQVPHEQDHT